MTGPDAREDRDESLADRPKIGDLLAKKYRVEKVIGEGGMGVVFAAQHLVLGQRVAVKVLHTKGVSGDVIVERFMREAQAVARLQGEHVARVMDAGSLENGFPFLAMEYLEGCDLEELVKLDGPLRIEEAADCVLQALAAIAEAHAQGIIHRDLKPSNLFLSVRPDGSNIVKILDFGISKQSSTSALDKELTGHAVLGTPTYMAPEQLRNASTVDSRADLWSLGVVLYVLLCGEVPFDGEGVGEIFAAILETEAPRVRLKRPDVPEGLDEIVARCLTRKIDDRWEDAAELARALAPFGSGRWDHLVEMAEQMLARSRFPKETEPNATGPRRVYPPGAATVTLSGKARARVTAPTPIDPLAVTQGRPSDEEIAGTNVASQSGVPRRRWNWLLVAGIALVIGGAIPIAASRHSDAGRAAASSSPSASSSSVPDIKTPVTVASAAPSAANSVDEIESDPIPSATPAPSSSHTATVRPRFTPQTPTRKERPSFLNQRK
jgi:serine/threonine protein kinase